MFDAAGNVANRLSENEEFRDLVKELDERYPIPGRTAIDQEMNKLVTDLKMKMGEALQNARRVAITTDIWSKKGLSSSYLGITAHFFSRKDHRRHCMTLAVRRLPSPHTGDRIEQLVCEVLDEWNILPQNVSAILTDNGSNMVCAFRDWVSESKETQDVSAGDPDVEEAVPQTAESGQGSPISSMESDEDMEEDGDNSSDAKKDILDFEEQEWNHDIAFSHHKRLSCLSHTLQLVVRTFDTIHSPKRALKKAYKVVKKYADQQKQPKSLFHCVA